MESGKKWKGKEVVDAVVRLDGGRVGLPLLCTCPLKGFSAARIANTSVFFDFRIFRKFSKFALAFSTSALPQITSANR